MFETTSVFGARLKEIRIWRGMTQAQLAKKSGVGKTSISNYEIGYSIPVPDVIEKLAEALEVTEEELTSISSSLTDIYTCFSHTTKVPYYESASYENIINSDDGNISQYLEIPSCHNVRAGNFVAIKANDNCMDNCKISKGDCVVIRRLTNEDIADKIENGNIYAFEYEGKIYIRKLFKNREFLTVAADSFTNSHRPFNVPYEDIKLIGKCVKAVVDL